MRFVEYKDWRQKISQNSFYREINISDSKIASTMALVKDQGEDVSNLTKILARRFCENSKEIIVAHPIGNMASPVYPADWRSTYINGK